MPSPRDCWHSAALRSAPSLRHPPAARRLPRQAGDRERRLASPWPYPKGALRHRPRALGRGHRRCRLPAGPRDYGSERDAGLGDRRASDDVLCFAAARLLTDPSHALVAVVRVGEAPVGLTAVRDGTLIVVADSNRFNAPGAHADLTVINVADALDGRPALVGHIPAGLFPRT